MPYDLNMPLNLYPARNEKNRMDYNDDTMITEMGHVEAQLIGRGLENIRF